jgi:hypothetical protein
MKLRAEIPMLEQNAAIQVRASSTRSSEGRGTRGEGRGARGGFVERQAPAWHRLQRQPFAPSMPSWSPALLVGDEGREAALWNAKLHLGIGCSGSVSRRACRAGARRSWQGARGGFVECQAPAWHWLQRQPFAPCMPSWSSALLAPYCPIPDSRFPIPDARATTLPARYPAIGWNSRSSSSPCTLIKCANETT